MSDDLTGIAEAEYGDHYRGHVLDIYTLYVEMADRVGQRRQSANAFFLSLNSAIVALVGYVQLGEPPGDTSAFFAPVALAGIAISYLWLRIIQSYRQLSSGKYKVVHEIESLLPLCPYDAEWTTLGRGKAAKKYVQLTRIESWVAVVFLAIHGVVLAQVLLG